jgi:hypothetical protein
LPEFIKTPVKSRGFFIGLASPPLITFAPNLIQRADIPPG